MVGELRREIMDLKSPRVEFKVSSEQQNCVSLQSCQLSTEVPMGKPLGQLVELGGEKGAVGTGAQVLAAWGAEWPL